MPWHPPPFAGGSAGSALLHAYRAAAEGDDRAAAAAGRHLDHAVAAIGDDSRTLGFFGGLTGVAWASRHVQRLLGGEVAHEETSDLDQVLVEALAEPWAWEYDLIYGLAGIGCYALDHPDPALARGLVAGVVDRLGALARRQGGTAAWWTSPKLMDPHRAAQFPSGCYDLGVAHGLAGVVGFLARAVASGHEVSLARPLLAESVAWLLAQRRPADGGSTFPC